MELSWISNGLKNFQLLTIATKSSILVVVGGGRTEVLICLCISLLGAQQFFFRRLKSQIQVTFW